ncbi:MAG TPA: Rad52/Rad22 family DNA repair protein [Pseudonocardiaceae bacterium]|jgi:hypothetical protein
MTALVLTPAQYDMLLQELPAYRVRQLRGQSHLEAWDVRRTLTRIFGFGGWDLETLELVCVREITYAPGELIRKRKDGSTYANDAPAYTVVYRCQARLIAKNPDGSVGASFDDGAAGDSQNQPGLGDAHDQAMKTALSQALKRCAVNLGDQFGLSLYNNGLTKAVVLRTLVEPGGAGKGERPAMPHDETPVQGEPEPVVHHEPEAVRPYDRPHPGDRPYEGVPDDYPDPDPPQRRRPAKNPGNDPARRRMYALLGKAELTDREAKLAYVIDVIGRPVDSSNDLTDAEVRLVCDRLESFIRQTEPSEASA